MTEQPLADAVECAIGLNVDCGGTQGVHRVRDAVLAALEEHLDLGDAEAWCKICRRVWDGKGHRCESGAEASVQRVTGLYEQWVKAGPPPLGTPMSRWWDRRLAELHNAILPPTDQTQE